MNEIVISPGELFVAAAVLGVVGLVLILLSNLILKAFGTDIHELARESEHVRELGIFDQLTAFFTDFRNIPASIGMVGVFLMFAAICVGFGALVWFVVRTVSKFLSAV